MKKIISMVIISISFPSLFAQPAPGGFALYNATNTNTVTLFSGITTTSYNIKFPLAQGTAYSILRNDGAGNLTWGFPGWSIIGNAGTAAGTNFIGTTDATVLSFKTANNFAGQLGAVSTDLNALGYLSGKLGNTNTYLGSWSGGVSTSSSINNVAVGSYALYNNASSPNNTMFGTGAFGTLTGGTGYNVGIGNNTGSAITTGSGNTIMGSNVSGLSGTLSNQIIIADGTGNQRIQVNAAGQLKIPSLTIIGNVPSPATSIISDRVVTTDVSGNVRSLAAPLFNEVIRGKGSFPNSNQSFTNHSNTSFDTPDFQVISSTSTVGGAVSNSQTINTFQVTVFQYMGAPLSTTTDAYGFVNAYTPSSSYGNFVSAITKIANVTGFTQISVSLCRTDVTGAATFSGAMVSLLVVR